MATMSDFELNERGEGHFELKGEMSFNTAEQILKASEKLFQRRTRIGIDLAAFVIRGIYHVIDPFQPRITAGRRRLEEVDRARGWLSRQRRVAPMC